MTIVHHEVGWVAGETVVAVHTGDVLVWGWHVAQSNVADSSCCVVGSVVLSAVVE